MTVTSGFVTSLLTVLNSRGRDADEAWRRWAKCAVELGEFDVPDLVALWQVVLDFDPVLARAVASPVEVPQLAVP